MMKNIKLLSVVVLLVLALVTLSGCAVSAQTAQQNAEESAVAQEGAAQTDDVGRLLDFVVALGALVPVIAIASPLISTLVDAAKKLGMNSIYAPAMSAALNATVFIVRYFVGPEHSAQFNSAINATYALAPYVIALVFSILATVGFHNKLTKVGLGYSKTPSKA